MDAVKLPKILIYVEKKVNYDILNIFLFFLVQ